MATSLPEFQACGQDRQGQQRDARFHHRGLSLTLFRWDAFLAMRQPVPQGFVGEPAAQFLHGRGVEG